MKDRFDAVLTKYKEGLSKNKNVQGIIHFGSTYHKNLWEKSDLDLMVITNCEQERFEPIYVRENNGVLIHIQYISRNVFDNYIKNNRGGRFHYIVADGELIHDSDGTILEQINALKLDPSKNFRLRILKEFSQLIDKYRISQKFSQNKKIMDAYRQLLASTVHWARIEIYQSGQYPRRDLWNQVYDVNIGVYKIYEELLFGTEPVEKKVELMQIIYLNMIAANSTTYAKPLLDILRKKSRAMRFIEIQSCEELKGLDVNLEILLEELVRLGIVKEQKSVFVPLSSDNFNVYEVKYSI
ncbi:MAG: hypothetical protein PHP06_04795 [Clostridia bacterium]|nr:hypothetical protein [Clostridia bacterium]